MDIGKLRRIASGQQFVLLALLGQVGFVCCNFNANNIARQQPPFGPPDVKLQVLSVLVPVVLVVVVISSLVAVIRLGWSLGHNKLVVVLFSPLFCVPLLNLILLAMLNARANKVFREAGVKVGLLGVSKASLDAYESETMGEVFD